MPSRKRRARPSDAPPPPTSQNQPRTPDFEQARGNAAAEQGRPEAEQTSVLDRVRDWFGRTTDSIGESWSDATNAASVAWDAKGLLRERDGQRRATVDASEASEALQDYGHRVGLDAGGRQMLAGVDFKEDQGLDILVDHNTEILAIGAEDLQIASIDQGAFRLGATRLTGMSAGGTFLSDSEQVEIFARAASVDASDFELDTPGGPIRAGRLSLEGFETEASYDRDASAMDAGSATIGSFSVEAATVSDVDLMGLAADHFSATDLTGGIDVDAGSATLGAARLEAEGARTGAMGGAEVGRASLSGLALSSDFRDPDAISAELHAEAAELAEVLTPYGRVSEVRGDGLSIAHDSATDTTTGGLEQARATGIGGEQGSIARAELTGGRMTHTPDSVQGSATRLGMIGVRSGDLTSAGIAVDEGRVRSEGGSTQASASHVRADDTRLGDQASVRLAQLSGFDATMDADGVRGGMTRGRLRGVSAEAGDAGKADLDELDVWHGRFDRDADGFDAQAERGSLTGVDLQTAGVQASLGSVSMQQGAVSATPDRAEVSLGSASLDDTRFRVDPQKAGAETGTTGDFDLARALESGSRLVRDVDASASADLLPGRYGDARVREGTSAQAAVQVRDGRLAHGTRVDFSRDIRTPFATDISGAAIDRRGQVEVDLGLPLLGRLFDFEVGMNATDQVNEAMGRSGAAVPTVAELGAWAAQQVRGAKSSQGTPTPLDLASASTSARVGLGPGTLDAGIGQVEVAEGSQDLSVQTRGIDQVIAQFSMFLANSLTVDLGGASATAGPGSVQDARIAIGEEGSGIVSGEVGRVDVEQVKLRS